MDIDSKLPDKLESKGRAHFPWRTLIVAITILSVIALLFGASSKTLATIEDLIGVLPKIASNFKTGNITQTFNEQATHIISTHGDVLEVATLKATETFSRSDSRFIFWNSLYIGTTTSEITVPATFRYDISLSGTWRLASKNNVCIVLAPAILPSLPPAIDTDGMQKMSTSGWARFNKEENLDNLEKGITSALNERASDSNHINLVREQCRQSVAAFIKRWLLKDKYWQEDRFSAIIVYFPDEIAINSDSDLEHGDHPPTITLQ